MRESMGSHIHREPVTRELAARLTERAQILIPEDGVYEKLKLAEKEGRPLRIKMGFDPTSPDLHLGHAVSMHELRRFQELGHTIVIIIGDFTGRIGDPSGRNKSRPLVSAEQLNQNAETYVAQLGKILDTSRIEVHHNSAWLEKMTLTDVIHLLAQGSLSQMISREDFRKRLEEGSPIALHEIVYPFLQGMDSLAVNADIEVGGVDQLYAFQTGRTLQENRGDDPQALVMMPLLRGLEGHSKMSKSLGNYIGLSDEPNEMYGKVMSIPDALLEEYLLLTSTFSSDEVREMLESIKRGTNPMEIKLRLAHNITTLYHSPDQADAAAEHFERQFRSRDETQRDFSTVNVPSGMTSLVDILTKAGAADSKSKARRLIEEGAVYINNKKITLEEARDMPNVDGLRIKAGRRHFFQIKVDG